VRSHEDPCFVSFKPKTIRAGLLKRKAAVDIVAPSAVDDAETETDDDEELISSATMPRDTHTISASARSMPLHRAMRRLSQ